MSLREWWERIRGQAAPVLFYHPHYRPPAPSLEARTGLDRRRADRVLWFLSSHGIVEAEEVRSAPRIDWYHLGLVHSEAFLLLATEERALAEAFDLGTREAPVEAILDTLRRATGGTLEAARDSLKSGELALNLLGGFHTAFPDRIGELALFSDVAVALSALREEGFSGRALVLDLDAHSPDGLAACLERDPSCRILSLSGPHGAEEGSLPGVEERLLPEGTGDEAYLSALRDLLDDHEEAIARAALTFVVAGGDVLAGDRRGGLALSLEGARMRDRVVAHRLDGRPSVWLPGGGYHPDSWKLLAGTALTLAGRHKEPIEADEDPLREHFEEVSRDLSPESLGQGLSFSLEEMEEAIGVAPKSRRSRFLGYYSPSGIELAFERYGLLGALRQLGYGPFHVALDGGPQGDRLRLLGRARGEEGDTEHLLLESVLERIRRDGQELLYVHWITLRHPIAEGVEAGGILPGQDHPGLGLGREIGEMLRRITERLGMAGLLMAPSWLHVAHLARHALRFEDPERHGRFAALLRDLGAHPIGALSQAMAEGALRMDGEPYAWEAEEMVSWPPEDEERWRARMEAERDRRSFTWARGGLTPPP